MLYLLWGLLNIAVFLFFVITCFRATRLVREQFGLFTSIIFVFGLLSFISNSNDDEVNKEPNSSQIRTWKFTSEDSLSRNATYFIDVELEKTLISKYQLGIKYGKDRQGQINIPISGNSWTTGFVSGTNWKPSYILVDRTSDNTKFEYSVHGTIEWKLLGATIYSQPKKYKGIVSTK
ncbi:hypothetical protein DYU11_19070 [Fibrisoma montanum]|uniref:Uncharacterized protein n=1 Tax=Fibrisoma montanum TaxID=2305895 RepID=A0A418M6W9_9BACT|nr:hypothetical protein [Fibrisoma montanum]RIV21505.1 hypothetical protein DYU11_19070 [Fibrisoma montanum]